MYFNVVNLLSHLSNIRIKMELTNTKKRVKLSRIVNYNGFADAFDNMPNKHRLTVRRELQKRLKWSSSSFWYKRVGESPLRENDIPVITEVFNRYNLNPWTGRQINT